MLDMIRDSCALLSETLENVSFTLRQTTGIGRRGAPIEEVIYEIGGATYRTTGVIFIRKAIFQTGENESGGSLDARIPNTGELITVEQVPYRILGSVRDLGMEYRIEYGDEDDG